MLTIVIFVTLWAYLFLCIYLNHIHFFEYVSFCLFLLPLVGSSLDPYYPLNYYKCLRIFPNLNIQFNYLCYLKFLYLRHATHQLKLLNIPILFLGLVPSDWKWIVHNSKWWNYLSWRGCTILPWCRHLDCITSLSVFQTWESWGRETFPSLQRRSGKGQYSVFH